MGLELKGQRSLLQHCSRLRERFMGIFFTRNW